MTPPAATRNRTEQEAPAPTPDLQLDDGTPVKVEHDEVGPSGNPVPERDEAGQLVVRLRHRKRCPKERIETYTAQSPEGKDVTVVRCIDCGEHEVADPGDHE